MREGNKKGVFTLPEEITALVAARNQLRDHYAKMQDQSQSAAKLDFTFDGNLVGDLGEALAVDLYGVKLVDSKVNPGIDGYAPDGRSVQVKATGTGRGPAFRCVETKADHLIFFDIDFDKCRGVIIYNGPEHYVTKYLPENFSGQRSISPKRMRDADAEVRSNERLQRLR